MEPAVGIEPTTHGLQNRCSTAELSWPKSTLTARKSSQIHPQRKPGKRTDRIGPSALDARAWDTWGLSPQAGMERTVGAWVKESPAQCQLR